MLSAKGKRGESTARAATVGVVAASRDAAIPTGLFVLYCFFVVDYFVRFSARIPGYGTLRPTLLLVGVIGLYLVLHWDKVRPLKDAAPVRALVGIIAYIVLSLPVVTWPGSVIRNNLSDFVKAIVFLFFTAVIVDTARRIQIFVSLLVGLQVFRVMEPLWLYWREGYLGSSTHLGGGEFAGRLAGAPADVVNPNGLAFVIATAIPFLHYLLGGSRRWWLKGAYVVVLLLLLYALILTMSRGGFIALAVGFVMIFWKSNWKPLLAAAAIAGLCVAWMNMSDIQKDRYLSLVSADTVQSGTVEGRLEGMKTEFQLALERPVFGHGLGTTPEAKVHAGTGRQAAHNMYAELIIELGLIGFLLYVRYLCQVWKLLQWNQTRIGGVPGEGGGSFLSRLNSALLTIFVVYAVYSLNYYGLSQYYWYLFGGLTVSLARVPGTVLDPEASEAATGDGQAAPSSDETVIDSHGGPGWADVGRGERSGG